MEGVAKYDFRANQEDEISFRTNDVLKILQLDEDKNWFRAELNGQIGYVPKNRVELKPNNWYQGRLTRRDAENILLGAHIADGAFLVRDSESTPGDFSLSVRFDNNVEHYRVLRDPSESGFSYFSSLIKLSIAGKYFLWVVKFNSLNELIEYHRTHSISRTLNILLRDHNFQSRNSHPQAVSQQHQMPIQPRQQNGFQQSSNESFVAVAAYRFVGEEDNELSFEPHEQINVQVYWDGRYNLDQQWWFGRIQRGYQSVEGLFPSNYVTVTDSVRQRYNIRTPTA